jgi:hypothetical protein
MTKPMTAADELRPYLNTDPRPGHVGCGVVMQLLVEHDGQRDRADKAEAELAEVRAWMADPYNRDRIAPVVQRAYRQRDEAVEEAAAAVEEYVADMKAAHAELAELRSRMAAEPAPFCFGEISDEELAAAEQAFTAAWAESKGQSVQILEPARTFVSQWSVRYLEDGEDGIVSEKHHTEVEARQRAKANPRTTELVTRLVEDEWRKVGDGDV